MSEDQLCDKEIDEFLEGKKDGPLSEVLGVLAELNAIEADPLAKMEIRRNVLAQADYSPRSPGWFQRWSAAVAAAAAFVLFSGSAVWAASGTLPGDPLYTLKLGVERVSVSMRPAAASKADAELRRAENRLAEIRALLEDEKPEQIGPAMKQFQGSLGAAVHQSRETPSVVRDKVRREVDVLVKKARELTLDQPGKSKAPAGKTEQRRPRGGPDSGPGAGTPSTAPALKPPSRTAPDGVLFQNQGKGSPSN
jgi:hypothetical protein